MASDPGIYDDQRTGDDLLERIIELETDGAHGHGWRFLLKACGAEIQRLRHDLECSADDCDDWQRTARRFASEAGWQNSDYLTPDDDS